MEGNTYVAKWRKAGAGYRAWLVRRPKQVVTGTDEEELKEQLWEIAMNAYGDGEACIELVPPLPAAGSGVGYFEPAWFRLSNNEGLHYEGDKAALYRDGQCPLCKTGQGGRNDVPRRMEPLRSDLGFVWWERPSVMLVSEAFLKFFGPALGEYRAIECEPEKRARQRFFELILNPELSLVAPKDAEQAKGMVCPKCDARRYGYFVCQRIQKGMAHAVVREELTRRKKGLVVAGTTFGYDVLINAAMAARLRRSKLRGVLLDRLALLPKAEVGEFTLTKVKKGD